MASLGSSLIRAQFLILLALLAYLRKREKMVSEHSLHVHNDNRGRPVFEAGPVCYKLSTPTMCTPECVQSLITVIVSWSHIGNLWNVE